ncbi:MAG: cupin domain-containing protein [Alicyclobacillaceae bacterium]|jgi:predicted cupin superfamily sugar epimerase|uniref:cupin domain-containing protein n=1 Tax=Alicyclobacillus sp. SP_1 TaxID=2942475 RepID=UPI002157C6D6|nr:cupin domain-containing protein [Alicyclobacillus sp. SP_1]MCY0887765.1 cupin domain-containing protein [Alicyclobacillaceae bacterium]
MSSNGVHRRPLSAEAERFVSELSMEPHPEGGYYAEFYQSREWVTSVQREDAQQVRDLAAPRRLATSIYFLLTASDVSRLHRLTSDELWYFHAGESLIVVMLSPDGQLTEVPLGLAVSRGQRPQIVVPRGTIFGAYLEKPSSPDAFSLVGCMVNPGFSFDDFELFDRDTLLSAYPQHRDTILRMT